MFFISKKKDDFKLYYYEKNSLVCVWFLCENGVSFVVVERRTEKEIISLANPAIASAIEWWIMATGSQSFHSNVAYRVNDDENDVVSHWRVEPLGQFFAQHPLQSGGSFSSAPPHCHRSRWQCYIE